MFRDPWSNHMGLISLLSHLVWFLPTRCSILAWQIFSALLLPKVCSWWLSVHCFWLCVWFWLHMRVTHSLWCFFLESSGRRVLLWHIWHWAPACWVCLSWRTRFLLGGSWSRCKSLGYLTWLLPRLALLLFPCMHACISCFLCWMPLLSILFLSSQ